MAESVISELTDAPAGFLDTLEAGNAPSERFTTSSLILTALTHRSRPRSTSVGFVGYTFRHDGKDYQIRERSASRKGGKQSFI